MQDSYGNKLNDKADKLKEIAATIEQPAPMQGRYEVLPEVIADLNARSAIGEMKYGTVLKTNNGRSALMDAYQEALDLCMYLKQLLMESQ